MNTNAMELNLDELEMVTGGDWWNRVKGALVGAAAGAVSGVAAGAIVGGMSGYEEMVVRTAALIT